MRDPDLVVRAQLAAAALEGAWHRWRVVHGLAADPMPTVSSYVGYSLEEPWGQPRVVFGLAAEDAEQLATLLERHDCVGPVYAAVTTMPGGREVPPKIGSRPEPLPVPRQAASIGAEPQFDLTRPGMSGLSDSLEADLVTDTARDTDCGEPVFRQAAAAMADAAAVREMAETAERASAPVTEDEGLAEGGVAEGGVPEGGVPEGGVPEGGGSAGTSGGPDAPGEQDGEDPLTTAGEADGELTADGIVQMGSLALAASAARAEAEARIRAALTDFRSDAGEATEDFILPQILATDVLEPLPSPPRPEAASGAYFPSVESDPGDADSLETDPVETGTAPAVTDQDSDAHIDDPQPTEPKGQPSRPKRGRGSRNYQMPRISKGKRPGNVPGAGQPAG